MGSWERYTIMPGGSGLLSSLTLLCLLGTGWCQEFQLANMFSDGMVLQRSPHSPSVWGRAAPGSTVTVTVMQFDDILHTSEPVIADETDGVWSVSVGSWPAGTGFSLKFLNGAEEVTVSDVAFGDVWLCSGQSNMQWTVAGVRDAGEEIENAVLYEDLRLMQVANIWSKVPEEEILDFGTTWTKPTSSYLSGDSFSAICLFFGEQLVDELEVPIGLIDSSWGGTIVEAWSPQEVLDECGVADQGVNGQDGPNHNLYLWNSMINPLLRMTIKGSIWYQGEQNAGYPGDYDGHNRDTEEMFPFGFVQLAPFTNQREHLAWPELRWKQTGNFGYVPNDVMQNVFMAAAMDDDIDLHPKNKRIPSTRLAWAASNLVYGNTENPLHGPQPTNVSVSEDKTTIIVSFSSPLRPVVVEEDRFMVCCLLTMEECDGVGYTEGWKGVTIRGMPATHMVELDTEAACSQYSGLAYLWLETPCSGEEECPLYSDDMFNMPVAPWKYKL